MTQRTALIAAAALVLAGVLPAGAQTAGSAKLVVPEQVLDFGTVTQGQMVNAQFKLRNEGDAPLEVRAVRPTCGCTVADFDKEVPPGGTGVIRAKLDTTNFNGPISKSLLVITNDPEKPSMNLVLKADVQPILEVLPRPLVRFNAIQLEQVTDKVTVVSDQPEPFTISKAVSTVPYITASVRKLGEGELVAGKQKSQYEVALTLTGKAPVGPINAEVVLKTDNPKAKEVPIKVFGVVRALLHVTPSQLQFGSVDAANSPGRNVLLVNNREGQAVQVTGAEVNDPAFEAKIMTIEEGRRYQVTVTVKPDATPGTRDAVLTIHTTDPDFSTVKVPVRADLK